MAKQIFMSAPQSVLLFGDFGVDYSLNCLNFAYEPRIRLSIKTRTDKNIQVNFPDQKYQNTISTQTPIFAKNIPKTIQSAVLLIHSLVINLEINYGFEVEIVDILDFDSKNVIPAIAANMIKGLAVLQNFKISNLEIYNYIIQALLNAKLEVRKYKIASAVYGNIIYYQTKTDLISKIKVPNFKLFKIKTDIKISSTLINKTQKYIKNNYQDYEENFLFIQKLVDLASSALKIADFPQVGKLMNRSQKRFQELGLVLNPLHKMCVNVMLHGADGAKISQEFSDSIMVIAKENQQELESFLQKNNFAYRVMLPSLSGVRMDLV